MSVSYAALNGDAGMITVKLFRRSDNVQVGPTNLSIYNFGFSEKDEESESNEIFTNINDKLIKDFYGYRKRIYFTLVNGANIPSPTANSDSPATNIHLVKTFVSCINLINAHQKDYRMQIQYRSMSSYGLIEDAIYVGDFQLKEFKEDSSSAQTIEFEFVSALPKEPINIGYSTLVSNIQLEDNDLGVVLLEAGNKVSFETQIDFAL
jgi:hypothetical protein